LLYHFRHNDYISEIPGWTSNKIFKIRCFQGTTEQVDHFPFPIERDVYGFPLHAITWGYSQIDSFRFFSMFYRLNLYRATFMLNLYYLKNTSTKFFPLLMLMLSNFIYQLRVTPLKLSWKKCINNFLSCTVSTILLHYTCRWVIGQYIPMHFFFVRFTLFSIWIKFEFSFLS